LTILSTDENFYFLQFLLFFKCFHHHFRGLPTLFAKKKQGLKGPASKEIQIYMKSRSDFIKAIFFRSEPVAQKGEYVARTRFSKKDGPTSSSQTRFFDHGENADRYR
jgi:hypothetical protein